MLNLDILITGALIGFAKFITNYKRIIGNPFNYFP